MAAIAVLDDRPDPRDTVVRAIGAALPTGWTCVICPLLDSITQYADWVRDHDVRVLVVDQVLNEGKPDTIRTVDYKGDQVTRAIRKFLPNFPIYIVTAYPSDPDLLAHTADVEDSFHRRQLVKHAHMYVDRMLRAGQRYEEEGSRKSARLAQLAAKVASGLATKRDKSELAALQTLLSAPSSVDVDQGRARVIARTEALLERMERLRRKIEKRHGRGPK